MTHNEEIYARQLYKDLQKEFAVELPIGAKIFYWIRRKADAARFNILLEGAGVRWHCTVSCGTRQCNISCFYINRTDVEYKGPEFYTFFKEDKKEKATGRTFNKAQTISSVKDWLENKTLDQLYSRYSFVDEKKRLLEKIRNIVLENNPELLGLPENRVVQELFSLHSLWFRDTKRSCRVYYYGYEEDPRYVYYWENTLMFETSGPDEKRMGQLIKKWVYDKAMPSVLKNEFTEIDFGKLSGYYEAGNGIEGEFILSWDYMEQFYSEQESGNKQEILNFIKEMREKGFDRVLRAGQSLYTLILSRSRRHGLREHQKSIAFSFEYIKSAMSVRANDGENRTFDKVGYNDAIEKLLKELCREPIN